jgi:hypothetical protein
MQTVANRCKNPQKFAKKCKKKQIVPKSKHIIRTDS